MSTSTRHAANGPAASASIADERRAQLRAAKRAQRIRERQAGRTHLQLTLPADLAERLRVAQRITGFEGLLGEVLDTWVVRVDEYPALADLAWSLTDRFLTIDDARGLYERNWRHVDQAGLSDAERALIHRLSGDELLDD